MYIGRQVGVLLELANLLCKVYCKCETSCFGCKYAIKLNDYLYEYIHA